MPVRMIVEVKGLEELKRKLEPKALYWKPLKDALDDLGKAAATDARRLAPRRTGALSQSITHKVNAVPVPLWVAVKTDIVSKSGSRYPWILEFDSKGKYGHRNWLKNAIGRVQQTAGAAIQRAIGQIEAKWRS